MPLRTTVLALALLAAVAWWLVHEDDETQVRDAHMELMSALVRSETDPEALSLLEIRALQQIFAPTCVVTGDARTLLGSYAPEEIVGVVMRARAAFRSIELNSTEPAIRFPEPDLAVTDFTASVVALGRGDGPAATLRETRRVTTRMRRIDGNWVFSELELSQGAEN